VLIELMKKLSLIFSLLLISTLSLSGPIQIKLEKDVSDSKYHHFEVEVLQRDGTIKSYTLAPNQDKITIDINYSKCTYYRAFSVSKDGVRSEPTFINEFRVQNDKVVPCAKQTTK